MKRSHPGIIIGVCALAAAAAAMVPSTPRQESRGEDGVLVVRNARTPVPGPGRPSQLSLTEELTIGRGRDDDHRFAELRAVQADAAGRIYALDGKECRIKVYDANGRYLRSIGRRGQGPGEMTFPSRIVVTPREEVALLDGDNRRLSFFSTEGELLREFITAKWRLLRFRVNGRGDIYADNLGIMEKGELAFQILRLPPDLSAATVLANEPFTMRPNRPDAFRAEFLHGLTREGGLAWAFTSRYEITVLDAEDRPRLRILKEPEPNPIGEDDRAALIRAHFGEEGIPGGVTFQIPSSFPPIRALVVSDSDHIIVRTYVRDERGGVVHDVFNPAGRYIARFSLGEEEFPMMARGGKIYTLVTEDEEGVPLVKRYGLVWE